MKRKERFLMLMSLFMLASCGGGSGGGAASANATKISFWGNVTQYSSTQYKKMVDEYNETQGKKDGVFVKYSAKSEGYSSNLSTTFRSQKAMVDVVEMNDRYFKNYAAQNYLANIDELMSDETLDAKKEDGTKFFDLNDFSYRNVDRFRFDVGTKTAGKGTTLYAAPGSTNPTVYYYNTSLFEKENINIISINEENVADYNAKNGTKFLPSGYCEYDVTAAPATGLKESTNLKGEKVIKVFNNCIGMSWVELDSLSKYFTQAWNSSSKSRYGFLNEWWFSYGWSVGGDCIDFDDAKNQYVFTLGSDLKNYLAVDDVTINGTTYKKGEVLSYKDKASVNANESAYEGKVYELPSQYEAFSEFCSLSQVKGKTVDTLGHIGYGISPSPATLNNTSKTTYFTSGSVAIVCESMSVANSIKKVLDTFDVAPTCQYKEYEGGQLDSENNFKVVGKTYDGTVYEGKVKAVNGVEIKGNKAASSLNNGWAIPNNSTNKKEAWKFIQWLSTKGQEMLASTNCYVPGHKSYAYSDEYLNAKTKIFKNYKAVVDSAQYTKIGDWSYLEDGEWVNYWANILNTDVRNGSKSLDSFFSEVQANVDKSLKDYKFRINDK